MKKNTLTVDSAMHLRFSNMFNIAKRHCCYCRRNCLCRLYIRANTKKYVQHTDERKSLKEFVNLILVCERRTNGQHVAVHNSRCECPIFRVTDHIFNLFASHFWSRNCFVRGHVLYPANGRVLDQRQRKRCRFYRLTNSRANAYNMLA